jgi:hypothetical protein
MSRRVLLSLLLAVLILTVALAAGGARARGTLDQSYTPVTTFGLVQVVNDPGVLGETFTAGLSGVLDTATLALTYLAPTPLTVTVGLFATDGSGFPTTPLASATASLVVPDTGVAPAPNQYTVVTFPVPGVVIAGQRYALVLTSVQGAAGSLVWYGQTPTSFTGGEGIAFFSAGGGGAWGTFSSLAFGFQTFVSPPPTPTPSPTPTATQSPAPTASPNPASVGGPAVLIESIAVTGCGMVTPQNAPVLALENLSYTAVPCPGSVFTGWTGGPCDKTRINPCSIPGGVPATANFSP